MKIGRHKESWRQTRVSLLTIDCALLGGVLLVVADNTSAHVRALCLVGAAVTMLSRLLCGALYGTNTAEACGLSKAGVLLRELSGRIADSLFLIFAGYAAQTDEIGVTLGWACALLAVLTAYIRGLGFTQGAVQECEGPMGAPYRMIVLAAACILGAVEDAAGLKQVAITWGLGAIAAGSVATGMMRLWRITRALGRN